MFLWSFGCGYALNSLLDLGIERDFKGDIMDVTYFFAQPILILSILSILNLNFFGEIVAVLTDEGVYTKKNFIDWNDITEIVFHSHEFSNTRHPKPTSFSYTEIFTTKGVRKIYQLPLWFLIKAKKYSSAKCKVKIDKDYISLFGMLIAIPPVMLILLKLDFTF